MPNIIWKPQPRQAVFMARSEYEVLYGGAAGGGKSDALLCEALRQVHIPHYRAIIFRKTYPQLSELIDRSQAIYRMAFPQARYNGSGHVWTFPSGAKIYFGNMQREADRINYQGKRYDFIGFDELTHFTWNEYSYMFSRNRPSRNPGSSEKTRVYIRATTNPGGIGHGWVKSRFIDVAPPMTPVTEEMTVKQPGGGEKVFRRSRVFVPSTVFDNPALLEADPNYMANLAMLPEAEKQALLYGSWESFSGQVFREWRNDPKHYEDQLWTHVIKPFQIPAHWVIYRGFDFGYTRPFSVGWYAADEEGRMYRIAEFYGTTGVPNEGARMNADEIAREIVRIEKEDPNLRGKRINGIADPAITQKQGGETIAELMAKEGVYWDSADNQRLAGKMQFHYRFTFGEDGRPMLYVFDTCRHFIRTIPELVYDEKRVEDVDTTCEDHIYDECRYVLMERPIAPRAKVKPPEAQDDPLDLLKESRAAKFFRL